MANKPDIWNGWHHNEQPVGSFRGSHGEIIDIYPGAAGMIGAMLQAIGPIPPPSEFGLGGHVEYYTSQDGMPGGGTVQAMYNPSGDVINQGLAAEYASVISAWNARVMAIQAVFVAEVQKGK